MPSCHSTNDIALEMVKKYDRSEGAVIVAGEQTKARGQRGNTWVSEPGKNLTMSLILEPHFLKASEQFFLNMSISLSVYSTIVEFNGDESCSMKWPNDLLIGNKKVAGILIENGVKKNCLDYSIVGIGLNINQDNFNQLKATSLSKEINSPLDLRLVFERLISNIESYYLKLKSGKFSEIKEEYLQNLFGYKIVRRFRGEYEFSGIIEGVENTGRLLISVNGDTQKFDFKEIEFLL